MGRWNGGSRFKGSETAVESYRQRGIEIVSTPVGDAPLKVRQAWIGLILPLPFPSPDGPVSTPAISVFAISTGWQSWLRWLFRRPYPEVDFTGYFVPSAEAIRILGEASPHAAHWWRRNMPSLLRADGSLVFDAGCCRLVDLPGPANSNDRQG